MKTAILLVAFAVTAVTANLRSKRQAYHLPDGAELIVGAIDRSFQCPQATHTGYYADVANRCQIFHICHPVVYPDGVTETLQWSFFCGNQTVFNQLTLTCGDPNYVVPCEHAADFYYVNQKIGQENTFFLEDADVAKANQVIAAYGARLRGGKK